MIKDLGLFEQFAAKYKTPEKVLTNDAVIYIRVSSDRQKDNYSPEFQLEKCLEYAKRNNLNIVEIFGKAGEFESAKTDERKEFQRMLSFIKKNQKIKISYILIYAIDRFSRTGISGAYIAEQLNAEKNIKLISVLSPVDPSTPTGRMQQSMQFVFSRWDNDLRRERCVSGILAKLKAGYWPGRTPIGYINRGSAKNQEFVFNEQGKLIKQAFIWKSEGVSNLEILQRLKARGLKLSKQSLNWILNNPFYCGVIVHRLLEGDVVEGKHPPLISRDLFLKVHNVQLPYKKSPHRKDYSETPLKHFIRCADCGRPFTGYVRKKPLKTRVLVLHYYKCPTPGCRCNRKAEVLHEQFENLLQQFVVSPSLREVLQYELERTYYEQNRENIELAERIREQLKEVEKKMETVEEKFVFNEITRELYDKYIGKLKEERGELLKDLQKVDVQISNLSEYTGLSVKIAEQLPDLYKVADYSDKNELQYMVFPEGIVYDRQIEGVRTNRVNSVFAEMIRISGELGGNKKRRSGKKSASSSLVGATGFEPVTPCL